GARADRGGEDPSGGFEGHGRADLASSTHGHARPGPLQLGGPPADRAGRRAPGRGAGDRPGGRVPGRRAQGKGPAGQPAPVPPAPLSGASAQPPPTWGFGARRRPVPRATITTRWRGPFLKVPTFWRSEERRVGKERK